MVSQPLHVQQAPPRCGVCGRPVHASITFPHLATPPSIGALIDVLVLRAGLAGTQSQTNTATVRAGNFVGEESVTISLNGSAVRCSGYNYTEPLTVPLQDNAAGERLMYARHRLVLFILYHPPTSLGAAAPFVIEANLFVVVYNSDIRVGGCLCSEKSLQVLDILFAPCSQYCIWIALWKTTRITLSVSMAMVPFGLM